MKGLIVFYMNFWPDLNQDPQQAVDLMRRINQDVIEAIMKETDYRVMVVPCTKESCRVEKVDFDQPFPRYSQKTHVELDNRRRREELAKADQPKAGE